MKRLKTYLMAAACTVGLIAFAGCSGAPDLDPNANDPGEEVNNNEDPDETGGGPSDGEDGKGEKQFKAKEKKDDEGGGDSPAEGEGDE